MSINILSVAILWMFLVLKVWFVRSAQNENLRTTLEELKTDPLIIVEKIFTGPFIDPIYQNDQLSMSFQCAPLFESILSVNASASVAWPPPTWPPPDHLRDAYLLNDHLNIIMHYFDNELQNAAEDDFYDWSGEYIHEYIGYAKRNCSCGPYNKPQCLDSITKYQHFIKDKEGLCSFVYLLTHRISLFCL